MLEDICQRYSIGLDLEESNSFRLLLSLFKEKNALVNLSAIRDEEGIIEKHFVDSILLNRFVHLSGNILDIGTGGGFPGLPLAITNQEAKFVLLDSTRKKIDAVNSFIGSLKLKNATGIWSRAEDKQTIETYANGFDFVISRATAYLPDIIGLSLPYLKKAGTAIFFKSENPEEIASGRLRYPYLHFTVRTYALGGQERVFLFVTGKRN